MIRAGAFKDVDTVLSWHPADQNGASLKSSLAIISAKFRFYGKPAHAAAAPDAGRSALDGLMIMANSVEFLREHVPDSTRIHYIVTNGGSAPNIVPEYSELFLYARHPSMPTLDGIWERIIKCAQAGALASETRMEMELIDSSYNTLPNDALAALVDKNMRLVGGVTYTHEEQAFAETIRKTLPDRTRPIGSQEKIEAAERRHGCRPPPMRATSVGPCRWRRLLTATFVPGVPGAHLASVGLRGYEHRTQRHGGGRKGLALTAVDLFTDPNRWRRPRPASKNGAPDSSTGRAYPPTTNRRSITGTIRPLLCGGGRGC